MKVLVCEDEHEVASFVADALRQVGYEVETTARGDEALRLLGATIYDAVILDRMLPGIEGLQVLREARSRGVRAPVLLLTAKFRVEDRIEGLDAGADDYLVKPFVLGELLARVRALIRRSFAPLCLAGVEIDSNARRVTYRGSVVFLSSTEFSLLYYLMQNAGRVVGRSQILQHVWDDHGFRGSNVVDVYVNYLRAKLSPELIQTVRGEGYMIADTHENED